MEPKQYDKNSQHQVCVAMGFSIDQVLYAEDALKDALATWPGALVFCCRLAASKGSTMYGHLVELSHCIKGAAKTGLAHDAVMVLHNMGVNVADLLSLPADSIDVWAEAVTFETLAQALANMDGVSDRTSTNLAAFYKGMAHLMTSDGTGGIMREAIVESADRILISHGSDQDTWEANLGGMMARLCAVASTFEGYVTAEGSNDVARMALTCTEALNGLGSVSNVAEGLATLLAHALKHMSITEGNANPEEARKSVELVVCLLIIKVAESVEKAANSREDGRSLTGANKTLCKLVDVLDILAPSDMKSRIQLEQKRENLGCQRPTT